MIYPYFTPGLVKYPGPHWWKQKNIFQCVLPVLLAVLPALPCWVNNGSFWISNGNASIVSPKDMFKFVDDLTALKLVNLLTIGLRSHHLMKQVPIEIPWHIQFIQPTKLKPQGYLNETNSWTINIQMMINLKKN